MKHTLRRAVAATGLTLTLVGCEGLDVPNLNAPDRFRALASGEDVKNLVAGAYNNWYFSQTYFNQTFVPTTVADHYTSSWGNFGMFVYSSEPRVAFINLSTDTNVGAVNNPWYWGYAALVSANLALIALDTGVEIGVGGAENAMVEASAKFIQAAVLANMALYFDRAYIVDETSDPTVIPELSSRQAVRDAALAKLDEVIGLLNTTSFTLPQNFMSNTVYTNTRMAAIANTIAARLIAYYPRNAAENTAANWAKVLQYAQNGISKAGVDFNPYITGDCTNWYDSYKYHGNEYQTWTRVDMRVVNLLDPAQPDVYPATGNLGPLNSDDARAATDFIYLASVPFNPARGRYHFSNIGHQRYRAHARLTPTQCLGDVPFMLTAENDLLMAEALVRTGGSKVTAAQLINKTRVGRGNLPALTGAESDAAMLDAIFYERDIDLMGMHGWVPYFDMRRTDRLQPLSFRHFPVPARELEVRGDPLYTFGGAGNPAFSVGRDGLSGWDFPGVEYNGMILQPAERLIEAVLQRQKEAPQMLNRGPF